MTHLNYFTHWALTIGYLTCALFLLTFIILSHRPGSQIPRLSAVWHQILTKRTTRIAIAIAWWWFGYHFLVHVIPLD